jgi:hypothetical protein
MRAMGLATALSILVEMPWQYGFAAQHCRAGCSLYHSCLYLLSRLAGGHDI